MKNFILILFTSLFLTACADYNEVVTNGDTFIVDAVTHDFAPNTNLELYYLNSVNLRSVNNSHIVILDTTGKYKAGDKIKIYYEKVNE